MCKSHDRQVGLEAAVRRQDGRVDDLPGGDVHLAQCRALHGVERAGTDHIEDAEGSEVDESGGLAHLQVLGVDDG